MKKALGALLAILIIFSVSPKPGFAANSVGMTEQEQIASLQMQIIDLLRQIIEARQLATTTPQPKEISKEETKDRTPRISYYYGKVNQHIDEKTGIWMTDPDGVSGAGNYAQFGKEGYGDRKLEYCQKWYPKTKSVRDYKLETIDTWRNRGNLSAFTSTRMSYECVQTGVVQTTTDSKEQSSSPTTQPATQTTTTPTTNPTTTSNTSDNGVDKYRISYYWGKVNQHTDPETGEWKTDPDGVSGANLDKLTYCKKWYGNTVSVQTNYKVETITTWHDAGNVSNYTSTRYSDRCVQP